MRTQKNDMQFSKDYDAGACWHDYVSVVHRRAQVIQIQLAIQKDVRFRLIDLLPAMNRILNLRFLSYICTLNVMSVIDWALEDGLWNFDGQGCSQSFGLGFKQMEASCVFWNWKLPEEWHWCVWNLETLSEEQASCAFWDFETSQKNKLHVFSETLKSSRKNILHVYSKTFKALTKTGFLCVQKSWSLCCHKKL
jgi:hypothetical protein